MSTALSPHLAGWEAGDIPPVLYLHKRRAYCTGTIVNPGTTPVGSLIATVPSAYRPSSTQPVIVPISPGGTTDACNPALNLLTFWVTAVEPDGKWVITSAIPESLNTAPPGASWYYDDGLVGEGVTRHAQYTNPFTLVLVLGNASWPVGVMTDEPSYASLAADLSGEVTDEGAEYALHGERVHLTGAVKSNVDELNAILTKTPPTSTDGLPLPFNQDYTTALLGGKPFPLGIVPGELFTATDSPIKPATETPPLAHFPHRMTEGEGEKATSGEIRVSETLVGPVTECNIEHLVPELGCVIDATQTCYLEISQGTGTHDYPHPVGPAANAPGYGIAALAINISDLLAMCHPQPDWYLVQFTAEAFAIVEPGGHTVATQSGPPAAPVGHDACKLKEEKPKQFCEAGCNTGFVPMYAEIMGGPFEEGETGEDPPFKYEAEKYPGSTPAVDEEGKPVAIEHTETPVEGELHNQTSVLAGLAAPPASLYKGVTHLPPSAPHYNVSPTLLWTPAQASVITANARLGGHEASLRLVANIIPFYERRQFGVHAADTLDLTKSGWEGVIVGSLVIGEQTRGVVPRTQKIVGRAITP